MQTSPVPLPLHVRKHHCSRFPLHAEQVVLKKAFLGNSTSYNGSFLTGFLKDNRGISSIPPPEGMLRLHRKEAGGGRRRLSSPKRGGKQIISKMFRGFLSCLWPGQQTVVLRGCFFEGGESPKRCFYLHFYSVLLLVSESTSLQ